MNLTDIHKTFHSRAAEDKFFLSVHEIFYSIYIYINIYIYIHTHTHTHTNTHTSYVRTWSN